MQFLDVGEYLRLLQCPMHVRYGSILNSIGVEMEMGVKCDLYLACFRPDLFSTRPSRLLAIQSHW